MEQTGPGTSPLPVGGHGSGWRWLLAHGSLGDTPAAPAAEPTGPCSRLLRGKGKPRGAGIGTQFLGVAGVVSQWETPRGWVGEDGPRSQASQGALPQPAVPGHQRRLREGHCTRPAAAGAWVEAAELCHGSQTGGLAAATACCRHGAQQLPLSPLQTALLPARLPSNTSSTDSGVGQPTALAHAARHHQAARPPHCAVSICPSHQQFGPRDALRSIPPPQTARLCPGPAPRLQGLWGLPSTAGGTGGIRDGLDGIRRAPRPSKCAPRKGRGGVGAHPIPGWDEPC